MPLIKPSNTYEYMLKKNIVIRKLHLMILKLGTGN